MESVSQSVGKRVIDFLTKCCDQFHAVSQIATTLEKNGFTQLHEKSFWKNIAPGKSYFVTRNSSTIVAFTVGANYKPGNGVKLLSGHTDSPCPKLKPANRRQSEGLHQVSVQLYGGGIWHTWLDRDLGVCGQVLLKRASKDCLEERLVQIDQPLLNIPNICVHLDRKLHENFAPNKEKHLVPIIATIEQHELVNGSVMLKDKNGEKRQPALFNLLASELGCDVSEIVDFDLSLYDHNKPTLGGAYNEFIFSSRQDNLLTCFYALEALIGSLSSVENEDMIRMVILYDNEEVGSLSYQGADSRLTQSMFKRIVQGLSAHGNAGKGDIGCLDDLLEVTVANSFHISSDAAHYVHPNYADKHEDCHKPTMNKGVVIKRNSNQRYSTSARSAAILKDIGRRASVPLQEVVVRNDGNCGTTVGPIIAANLGIESVDIGVGLLSMHSVRETGHVGDVEHGINLIRSFFSNPLPQIVAS